MLKEDIVATPKKLEGWNRDEEMAVSRGYRHIIGKKRVIILDMLKDIHHQHQISITGADTAPE